MVVEEGRRPRNRDSDTGKQASSIVAGTSHLNLRRRVGKTRAWAVFGRCSTSESCSIHRSRYPSHPLTLHACLGSTIRSPIHATLPGARAVSLRRGKGNVCCTLPPTSATRPTAKRGTRHSGGNVYMRNVAGVVKSFTSNVISRDRRPPFSTLQRPRPRGAATV